jgi:HlyD family secretion protein
LNRGLIIALTLTAALSLSGCVDRQAQQQAKNTQKIVTDPTQVVAVQPVVPQTIAETLEITGEVATGQDTQVGAKQSGKLVAVYVKDGDPVGAGQIIALQDATTQQGQLQQALATLSSAAAQLSQAISNAKFGPSKSAAAVRQAQAQLKSAQANLAKVRAGARKEERIQTDWAVKQAKTNLDIAQKDVERKQDLYNQGAIPKTQLEQAQNAYMAALTQYNSALQNQAMQNAGARPEDIAVAEEAVRSAQQQVAQARAQQDLDVLYKDQVQAAQAAVNSARAQVDVARQAVADTQIKAPYAGRIAGKPAQPGEVVGPGSVVARIIGGSGLYFEGEVPESEITRIRTGSPVSISISAVPGRTFSGSVAAINPLASNVGRLYTVRIGFNAVSSLVKPGMFATGSVTLRTIPNAVMVPATAVVEVQGKQVVWVMNGDRAVKANPVETGLRKQDEIQIVSGLAPGERVVIRGQEGLNEKSKVRVEERTTARADHSAGTVGG